MAEPKQKSSRARTRKRRASQILVAPTLTLCPKCHQPLLPHTVCQVCGTYKGRQVIEIKTKISKKAKKEKKEKAVKAKGEKVKKTGKEKK